MAFDAHANLAIGSVAVAPVPPLSGVQLTLTSGHGARFTGAPPFNVTVWPAAELPTPLNAEIARCTARAGDVLTLQRAQEGTTARAIGAGDFIAAGVTAKSLTDIEQQAALKAAVNVFTTDQSFVGPSVRLVLTDTSAPPDGRVIDLINGAQAFHVRTLNDAQTVVFQTPLTLDRLGVARVAGPIHERGRTAALGSPEVWTPALLTDASVACGGTVTGRLTVVGLTAFYSVEALNITIPASTAFVYVLFPPPLPPAGMGETRGFAHFYVPGAGYQAAVGIVSSAWGTGVRIYRLALDQIPPGAGHLWVSGQYYLG